jgi:macrolide transport system ATP-binding/permease protein
MIHTWFSPSWVVRSNLPLNALIAPLQQSVASVDPQLPFAAFHTMDDIRSQSVAFQRLQATLLGVLSALALALSALGIYGLIANSVIERTREFGIRLALGSSISSAIRALAAPGIILAGIGLIIGCALAAATSKLLSSLIWGVTPSDPATFAAVCATLLVVALIASVLPSLRVASINPADTLRE